MNYNLPKTVDIKGEEFEIRYDFRVILEIIQMINDPELSGAEKARCLIHMFYMNPEHVKDAEAAIRACYAFIDQNEKPKKKSVRLMDWEQDFDYIIAPINRVLGAEIRGIEYDVENNTGGVHWWTFLSAYMEIGTDCLMAQIVSARDKLARHKHLEKSEREWIRQNRYLIDIHKKISDNDRAQMNNWIKGGEKPSG